MPASAVLIGGSHINVAAARLEILSNVGAGLGCVAYALLLWSRSSSSLLHRRLARFLATLGAALFARGVVWATGSVFLAHLMLAAFGLFPLLLALFFESLLRRRLHLWAKIVLLAGTVGFVGTAWASWSVDAPEWSLALIGYHSLTVAYLGCLTLLSLRRAAEGPRRSLYGATLLVCAVAVVLMATDWTYLVGLHNPKLGAIPALAILFFGGSMLDAGDQWRLRAAVLRLAIYVASALALAGLVSLALREERAVPFFLTAGTLLFASIAFEPFRVELHRRQGQHSNLLSERLSHLNARSLSELLESLRCWPEVERLALLRASDLPFQSPSGVMAYLDSNGSVVAAAELERAIALTSERERLFVLEQMHHVMHAWKVQYLGRVTPEGDLFGITFHAWLDPSFYRRTFELVVFVARLVAKEGK